MYLIDITIIKISYNRPKPLSNLVVVFFLLATSCATNCINECKLEQQETKMTKAKGNTKH